MPVQGPALNYQSSDPATGQIATNREITSFGDLARQLGVDQLVLINFLMDHQVGLDGAVNGPGSYFVGPSVPLQDLVQAAGGTANWADESGVELISTAVDSQSGHSATRRTQLPLRQGMLASYIVRLTISSASMKCSTMPILVRQMCKAKCASPAPTRSPAANICLT